MIVHSSAKDVSLPAMCAAIIRLAYKVRGLLRTRGIEASVLIPPNLLHRSVFHMHVPMPLLSDTTEALNLLDSQEIEHLSLPPQLNDGSRWKTLYEAIDLVQHHTTYLVRSVDFSQSYFCNDALQLHESLARVLHVPVPARNLRTRTGSGGPR